VLLSTLESVNPNQSNKTQIRKTCIYADEDEICILINAMLHNLQSDVLRSAACHQGKGYFDALSLVQGQFRVSFNASWDILLTLLTLI